MPLFVDPNAPLPSSIAFQSLQSIAGWYRQVSQAACTIDNFQLVLRSWAKAGG
jgi:hypothetical protein